MTRPSVFWVEMDEATLVQDQPTRTLLPTDQSIRVKVLALSRRRAVRLHGCCWLLKDRLPLGPGKGAVVAQMQ